MRLQPAVREQMEKMVAVMQQDRNNPESLDTFLEQAATNDDTALLALLTLEKPMQKLFAEKVILEMFPGGRGEELSERLEDIHNELFHVVALFMGTFMGVVHRKLEEGKLDHIFIRD